MFFSSGLLRDDGLSELLDSLTVQFLFTKWRSGQCNHPTHAPNHSLPTSSQSFKFDILWQTEEISTRNLNSQWTLSRSQFGLEHPAAYQSLGCSKDKSLVSSLTPTSVCANIWQLRIEMGIFLCCQTWLEVTKTNMTLMRCNLRTEECFKRFTGKEWGISQVWFPRRIWFTFIKSIIATIHHTWCLQKQKHQKKKNIYMVCL